MSLSLSLRDAEFVQRFLKCGEQAIRVRRWTESDANAALAAVVAGTIANQNSTLPHALGEAWQTKSRENEIRVARPEWNPGGAQSILQPFASRANFAHVSPNVVLIGERIGEAGERDAIQVVRGTHTAHGANLFRIAEQYTDTKSGEPIGF